MGALGAGSPLKGARLGNPEIPLESGTKMLKQTDSPATDSPAWVCCVQGGSPVGSPLGEPPIPWQGGPTVGGPLQVGRQRWTCGARWLSPSHQLTESMLQTGAGCRTAPPLCAGGAAKKKEAPQLGALVGLPRRPPGPPGRKAEQPPGRGRAPRRGTACTICVRREESYLPYWPALVFGRGSKKRGLASWEPPSHCPALVCGRGSKKKGAPWPPFLWFAPEATWASGANNGQLAAFKADIFEVGFLVMLVQTHVVSCRTLQPRPCVWTGLQKQKGGSHVDPVVNPLACPRGHLGLWGKRLHIAMNFCFFWYCVKRSDGHFNV